MKAIKAIFLGTILTFVVAGAIGAAHSGGGYLNVHSVEWARHYFWWSWPLFIVSSAGAFGILLLME